MPTPSNIRIRPETPRADAAASLETVRAKVTILVPEFRQVHLETADGRGLAVTPRTPGIDLATLLPGQVLECVVDTALARVISARSVA